MLHIGSDFDYPSLSNRDLVSVFSGTPSLHLESTHDSENDWQFWDGVNVYEVSVNALGYRNVYRMEE